MKFITLAVFTVGIAALLTTAGCKDSIQKRVEQAKEDAQTEQQAQVKADEDSRSDYMDEWQAFRSEAERQIKANAAIMDDLKAKAATSSDQLKAQVGVTVEKLAQQNQELAEKLKSYKDEGKLNWDAFRRDFSRELDGLSKSLKSVQSSESK